MKPVKVIQGAIAALLPSVAFAGPVNPGFEDGTFGAWTATGASTSGVVDFELGRQLGTLDWSATEGRYFASLWSTDNAETPTSYSEMSQSFAGAAGEVLSFDYFFDLGDPSGPDLDTAIAVLSWSGGSVELLNFNGTGGVVLDEFGEVGWATEMYVLGASDTYTLTFRTEDADGTFESIFGVDNVLLGTGGPIIPLPTGSALAGAALCAFGVRRRRTSPLASI